MYCLYRLPVLQWDYTRIKLEEPPELVAARARLAAAGGGDLEQPVSAICLCPCLQPGMARGLCAAGLAAALPAVCALQTKQPPQQLMLPLSSLPPTYCLCLQEKEEVVETPTMLHIMGQNNLLQRTGFKQGDVELED